MDSLEATVNNHEIDWAIPIAIFNTTFSEKFGISSIGGKIKIFYRTNGRDFQMGYMEKDCSKISLLSIDKIKESAKALNFDEKEIMGKRMWLDGYLKAYENKHYTLENVDKIE